MSSSPLYPCIYALVSQVPAGRVTTYGQVAVRAGCPPRVVGFALAALGDGSSVPWQRVVNRRGEVSSRRSGDGSLRQRLLLEAEGVSFDAGGRIDLARYGWDWCELGPTDTGRVRG